MRKVISALFITLDGVTESPDQWQFDHFDADMMEGMGAELAEQDTVLLGRVTYQEWANYWPNATDEPYANFINSTPKYVVSRMLEKVEWGDWENVTLLKGDLAEEITRLKDQPGEKIGVQGSPTLVRSLLRAGLIDELTLLLHPVVAGKGKRLFQGDSDLARMRLVYSKETRSGVMILTYEPR